MRFRCCAEDRFGFRCEPRFSFAELLGCLASQDHASSPHRIIASLRKNRACVRQSHSWSSAVMGWQVGSEEHWCHGQGRSRALKGLQQVSPGPNAVAKPRSAASGSFAETRPGWRHREILSTWPSVYPAKRHDALPRRVVLGVASSEGATTRRWRGTRGGAALCPGLTCLALLGPKSLPRRYSDDMRPERAAPGQPGAKRRGRGGARVQLVRRAGGH